jgi:poly-gamma-glutamate capsule biosynthesis protein CapA/YwtB (metallophosphatase superfamily)
MARWLGKNDRTVSLILCGDINLQQRDDPRSAFALVKADLAEADVLFGDHEMCLFKPSSVIADKPGWTQSDERMVEGLVDAGFDVVGCANNVNHGAEAILSSIDVLERHGVEHTGSGRDLEAARAPAIVEKRGVRFGFLANTAVFFPHDHAAGPDSPGVATIKCHTAYEPHPRVYELPGAPAITRSWPDPAALERVCEDVRRLRPRVDVLVAYFHWGVSGQDELAEYQPTVGHAVVDAGADLVVGSHAHVPQGIEIYRDRVILYGLGNFAFDWVNMARHREGLIAHCAIEGGTIRRVSVKPVWRGEDQLNQPRIVGLDDARGREIVSRVRQLSEQRGTALTASGDEIVVWER